MVGLVKTAFLKEHVINTESTLSVDVSQIINLGCCGKNRHSSSCALLLLATLINVHPVPTRWSFIVVFDFDRNSTRRLRKSN
jgi:hypothetical protein